jgi:hypothetical protein
MKEKIRGEDITVFSAPTPQKVESVLYVNSKLKELAEAI